MASCQLMLAIVCALVSVTALLMSAATPSWARLAQNSTRMCGCTRCDCGLLLSCEGGFLSQGYTDNCWWFFQDNFRVQSKLPGWFQAVQCLMAAAVLTSLAALVVVLSSLCCFCKRCHAHRAAGILIGLTVLLVVTAVTLFGVQGHLHHNLTVLVSDDYNRDVQTTTRVSDEYSRDVQTTTQVRDEFGQDVQTTTRVSDEYGRDFQTNTRVRDEYGRDFQTTQHIPSGQFGWSYWLATGSACGALLTCILFLSLGRSPDDQFV